MTSMETPRLLSEYFAARAQSVARISACADVDVASVRIKNPLQPLRCAKRNHDEPFMRGSCRRQADGYDSGVVAGVDDPARRHHLDVSGLQGAPSADSVSATLPRW